MSQSASRNSWIFATIVYGLAIVPCSIFALMTSMVADGDPPGWLVNWIFFGSLAVPISILLSTTLAWLFYFRKRYTMAAILPAMPIVVSLIPLIGIILLDTV